MTSDDLIALATCALVVVGIVQAIIFGFQWNIFKKQKEVFEEQAKQLKKTVEQMQIAEQRELRGYVFPKIVEISFPKEDSIVQPIVTATIVNFGKTPAFNLYGGILLAVGVKDQAPPFPPHPTSGILMTLPPTGQISLEHQISLTQVQLTELVAGELKLYIHGFIGYSDSFNNQQFYEFTQFHGFPDTGVFGQTPNIAFISDSNQTNGKVFPKNS